MGACSGKQINKDDIEDKKPQKKTQTKDEETTIGNDNDQLRIGEIQEEPQEVKPEETHEETQEEKTLKDICHEIKSEEEYNECIKSGTTIVYFLPKNELNVECNFLNEIAKEHESLKFIKLNGNTLKNVGFDIDELTIPVFNIYKEGELLEKVFDAENDKEILERLIKKHI